MDLLWIALGVAALLVVVFVVRAALRSMRPKVPTPAAPTTAIPVIRTSVPRALSPATAAEVDRLVRAEQKIAAIKVLRDATGVSLQEAKDRVDRWVPGGDAAQQLSPPGGPIDTAATLSGMRSASEVRATLSPSVAEEIDRLVVTEQPVAAIKLLRDHTGYGLKESKHLVETWGRGPR
ncbi:ribosomal protein L7/L12 [Microbacterium sp. XT11]|uniref:ribosomal protein L7/L12 n=1 Tax=Microbacterium sp. XT11 TaxID=367477 RepID=UPI0007430A9E|nr:ribosomal protein L7/L12 [Microbacterium sp. XT11]ALX65800.1 hypothetical protein AB663_000514 [Microbacterium sp. XT11]